MSNTLNKYDSWLTGDDSPAALVIQEHVMPVEGHDGALFPPTFAAGDGFPGGYNIDTFGDEKDGKNVCLIDSVGSQANRIEPIFAEEKYAGLIPQIVVKAGEKEINITEAGHRAGDASMRCSELQRSYMTRSGPCSAGTPNRRRKSRPRRWCSASGILATRRRSYLG